MELMEALQGRRSIRKFTLDPVDEKDLEEIVRAGTLATNAENAQMWYFVAVTNRELIERAGDAVQLRIESLSRAMETLGLGAAFGGQPFFLTFFRHAPAFIAVFTRPFVSGVEKLYRNLNGAFNPPIPILPGLQSIGAAIQNIALAAYGKGYGTTCMNGPVLAYREIAELLGVPEPWVLAALMPIGRPAHRPKARPHKPLEEVYRLIR